MPISAILTAVDFSNDSRRAARVAALVARRHGARLTLLHVDPMNRVLERMALHTRPDVWEQFLRDRRHSAQRLLDEIAVSLGDVNVGIEVVQDEAAVGIIERAGAHGSDLVVIGAQGTGSSGHAWLGSVSFEVAACVPCAVLVVRERAAPTDGPGFRRPLIAVGMDRPIEPALATATWLCAADAVFDVVHVSEWPAVIPEHPARRSSARLDPSVAHPSVAQAREQTLEKRSSWLNAAAARVRHGLVHLHVDDAESTSSAILERIDRRGNDLVVLGRRAPPTLSGSLGAAVRRLLEYADVSVALVPTPALEDVAPQS